MGGMASMMGGMGGGGGLGIIPTTPGGALQNLKTLAPMALQLLPPPFGQIASIAAAAAIKAGEGFAEGKGPVTSIGGGLIEGATRFGAGKLGGLLSPQASGVTPEQGGSLNSLGFQPQGNASVSGLRPADQVQSQLFRPQPDPFARFRLSNLMGLQNRF